MKSIRTIFISALSLLLVFQTASAIANQDSSPISLSGYFWVDTSYQELDNKLSSDPNEEIYVQEGRFKMIASARKELNTFFVQANGDLLLHVNEEDDYEIDTDDAWVKFGTNTWDLQAGRFEAWELYHKGMGLELYTKEDEGAKDGTDIYEVDYARGRMDGTGQLALHLFPIENLGIEIAGIYGNETNVNSIGVRPAVTLGLGSFYTIVACEYVKETPQKDNSEFENEKKGGGIRLEYRTDFITTGINYAFGSEDNINFLGEPLLTESYEKSSIGGYFNIDFGKHIIGLGSNYTKEETDNDDTLKHIQSFIAYEYELPIDGASVKFIYSGADADNDYTGTSKVDAENAMNSYRVRIRYNF